MFGSQRGSLPCGKNERSTTEMEFHGELEEALRIRREEELPVYERLGDVRELLVGRVNMAILLLRSDNDEARLEAAGLLRSALTDARRLGIPEADRIARIMEQAGIGEV